MMKIEALGHVVINVRNLEKSEAFYNGLLGIPIAARMADPSMTFFSLGNHHDLAIAAVGDDAKDAPENTPGLAHVAFRIGNHIDTLREAKAQLEKAGVMAEAADHGVTQSLYFADPDGNTLEVYVDVSDVWKKDPQQVAQYAPLAL
jgi:catechol 2,3-dioxygenase